MDESDMVLDNLGLKFHNYVTTFISYLLVILQ